MRWFSVIAPVELACLRGLKALLDPQGLMKQPGFKVFHIQDIDFRSNCPTFKLCLQELKRWSVAHPDHPPVYVTMTAKSEAVNKPGFTVPEPFTAAAPDESSFTAPMEMFSL